MCEGIWGFAWSVECEGVERHSHSCAPASKPHSSGGERLTTLRIEKKETYPEREGLETSERIRCRIDGQVQLVDITRDAFRRASRTARVEVLIGNLDAFDIYVVPFAHRVALSTEYWCNNITLSGASLGVSACTVQGVRRREGDRTCSAQKWHYLRTNHVARFDSEIPPILWGCAQCDCEVGALRLARRRLCVIHHDVFA